MKQGLVCCFSNEIQYEYVFLIICFHFAELGAPPPPPLKKEICVVRDSPELAPIE